MYVCKITDRNGNPNVFNLNSDDAQLNLNGNNAHSDNRWNSDNQFVFLATLFISLLNFEESFK